MCYGESSCHLFLWSLWAFFCNYSLELIYNNNNKYNEHVLTTLLVLVLSMPFIHVCSVLSYKVCIYHSESFYNKYSKLSNTRHIYVNNELLSLQLTILSWPAIVV